MSNRAAAFTAVLGPGGVVTGADLDRWRGDWTGKYPAAPEMVLRPASTAEVSAIMKVAQATGTPIVPVSGLTNVTGAVATQGGVMLSLDRMNRIREIRPEARVAVVEAGVVLSALHAAAEEVGLVFPLTFGAKGSAMIGGALATNAGGSNVLRYGNARDLCLGIEVVLADGRVVDLMSALHKDNSGYNLRHLMIGSEGTLGVITAAVVKLFPRPLAYATAMVAVRDLPSALVLLNRLQEASGGAVEAFEYMPGVYMEVHAERTGGRMPFEARHEVNLLVELGATAPRDADPLPDGSVPVVDLLETTLAGFMAEGLVIDAVTARTEAQRREMWARREAAAEITFWRQPLVDCDVAVPLDRVAAFFEVVRERVARLDPGAEDFSVAHLGDGNIHYTVYPSREDKALMTAIREAVDGVAADLGGSFSAEHGIGLSKRDSMAMLKDPVALDVMRAIKAALDPEGILNPGKVLPDA